MRYLTTLLLPAMLLMGNVKAQDYDIGISRFVIPDEDNLTLRIHVNEIIQSEITNYGQLAVPGQTSFEYDVSLDGNSLRDEPIGLSFPNNFQPGATINTSAYIYQIPDLGEGQFELCSWTDLANDADPSNDMHCQMANLEYYQRDIGVAEFTGPNMDTLYKGINYQFYASIGNFSDESISMLVYRRLFVARTASAQGNIVNPSNLILGLENPLQPSASTNVELPQFSFTTQIPDGYVDVCVIAELNPQVDPNQANNEECHTYYITTEPDNTSLSEVEFFADNVNVYPNPSSGDVNFTFHLNYGGSVSVKLYDIAGRLVHEFTESGIVSGERTVTMEQGTLESGTYFYKLRSNSQNFEGKLVIQ